MTLPFSTTLPVPDLATHCRVLPAGRSVRRPDGSALADTHALPGFGPGTLISTTDGELPVEWLTPGDRVITRDRGIQTLRRIARTRLSPTDLAENPQLCPVLIEPDSFAGWAPDTPLAVSPALQIVVTGWDVQLYFGADVALADAGHMCTGPAMVEPGRDYCYCSLLFDAPQIIRANGMWIESRALKARRGRNGAARGAGSGTGIARTATYPVLLPDEARLLCLTRHSGALKRTRNVA
ncbi:MAG: Hint domain-containing protein [Rhodobacter sp.]|nr:Hint domain-containing protein [Rhodobacter sp.]